MCWGRQQRLKHSPEVDAFLISGKIVDGLLVMRKIEVSGICLFSL